MVRKWPNCVGGSWNYCHHSSWQARQLFHSERFITGDRSTARSDRGYTQLPQKKLFVQVLGGLKSLRSSYLCSIVWRNLSVCIAVWKVPTCCACMRSPKKEKTWANLQNSQVMLAIETLLQDGLHKEWPLYIGSELHLCASVTVQIFEFWENKMNKMHMWIMWS